MLLESLSQPFGKAFATDGLSPYFDVAHTRRYNQLTEGGIFDLGFGGGKCPNQIIVIPYAGGDVGNAFAMRISGWRQAGTVEKTSMWIRTCLAQFGVVTGQQHGLNGLIVAEYENLAVAMALQLGSAMVYPAVDAGGIAYAVVPMQGVQKVQFEFVATSMDFRDSYPNCLWARA